MSVKIYVEGGPRRNSEMSAAQVSRCKAAFHSLLTNCGFFGRQPAIIPCGSRGAAFKAFKTAFALRNEGDFVALWVDSEDPIPDIDATWAHLKARPGDEWAKAKPTDATDEQVFLMTTSMETLIVADHKAIETHFNGPLAMNRLPSLIDLESKTRDYVLKSLVGATVGCTNRYAKGDRSFDVLGELSRAVLEEHLPSFKRTMRILESKVQPPAQKKGRTDRSR